MWWTAVVYTAELTEIQIDFLESLIDLPLILFWKLQIPVAVQTVSVAAPSLKSQRLLLGDVREARIRPIKLDIYMPHPWKNVGNERRLKGFDLGILTVQRSKTILMPGLSASVGLLCTACLAIRMMHSTKLEVSLAPGFVLRVMTLQRDHPDLKNC